MTDMTWQKKMDSLAYGDVYPYILAADIHFSGDADGPYLDVAVVLVDAGSVHPGGYASTSPIYTERHPGPDPGVEARPRLVAQTMNKFADRLRAALEEAPS